MRPQSSAHVGGKRQNPRSLERGFPCRAPSGIRTPDPLIKVFSHPSSSPPCNWPCAYPSRASSTRTGGAEDTLMTSTKRSRAGRVEEPLSPPTSRRPHALRSFVITDHDGGEADRIAELQRLPEPSSVAQNRYTVAGHGVVGEPFSRGRSCAAAIIAENSVGPLKTPRKSSLPFRLPAAPAKVHQDGTHQLWLGLHGLADI